jgi:RNA polymerase sigma factor (sigma-70 family)
MVRLDTRSDNELVAAFAAGDERAFETFYRRHLGAVVGFLLRRTHQRELAFDLTAETFAAVVVASDRFDSEIGNAGAWLFGIAANKLRESLRRGRVEEEARRRLAHELVVFDDGDLDEVERLAATSSESQLEALLGAISQMEREAIQARVLDERPYEDIARSLSCSEAVVRQRVHRGLRRLKLKLKESA